MSPGVVQEGSVWSGSARNRWLPAAAALGVVAAFAVSGRRWLYSATVFGVVASLISYVRVSAGPAGVTTRMGVFGWPRHHIATVDIKVARAIFVAPLAYGGWGWRLRRGRAAAVVRRGEGLELELTTGRRFIVTVDGAEQGARVINDLLPGEPKGGRVGS